VRRRDREIGPQGVFHNVQSSFKKNTILFEEGEGQWKKENTSFVIMKEHPPEKREEKRANLEQFVEASHRAPQATHP